MSASQLVLPAQQPTSATSLLVNQVFALLLVLQTAIALLEKSAVPVSA
jgi:hypothetical protein